MAIATSTSSPYIPDRIILPVIPSPTNWRAVGVKCFKSTLLRRNWWATVNFFTLSRSPFSSLLLLSLHPFPIYCLLFDKMASTIARNDERQNAG